MRPDFFLFNAEVLLYFVHVMVFEMLYKCCVYNFNIICNCLKDDNSHAYITFC